MEITDAQIATLVLGYLKNEKYTRALGKFVNQCEHFKTNRDKIKSGNFVTRVYGMSLVEYLREYATISSIVQERLDNTNYYNERGNKTTLIDQILYLLDTGPDAAHTVNCSSITSEVETTSVDSLPGNSVEGRSGEKMTPKRRSRGRSRDSEGFDMSELLTQTFLEKPELHAKLAETINIVRSTPEMVKSGNASVEEQNVSMGASKELDDIIKTVVQKTEEDPAYNKLLDEIIGSTTEIASSKKANNPISHSTPHLQSSTPHKTDKTHVSSTIDQYNNDAVRCIIAASNAPKISSVPAAGNKPEANDITIFNGSLDSYLKTSGASCYNPAPPQEQLFVNNAPLLVLPTSGPYEYQPSVQPVLSISDMGPEKNMLLSDNDILAMPTIIVNEEPCNSHVVMPKEVNKYKTIAPKLSTKIEVVSQEVEVVGGKQDIMSNTPPPKDSLVKKTTPKHVRNLDFSTPLKNDSKESSKTWDSDLRQLLTNCQDKTPQKLRQAKSRQRLSRSKDSSNVDNEQAEKKEMKTKKGTKKKETHLVETETEQKSDNDKDTENKDSEKVEEVKKLEGLSLQEKIFLPPITPLKDGIPNSTASIASYNSLTPFTQVLEEQLQGIDLTSLPTPKMPITPGFSLTPGPQYPNRSTDYSTSSSYYQPSDTEQNKSIEQLIEESKSYEANLQSPTKLKILSNVVVQQSQTTEQTTTETTKTNCNEYLKKFNTKVIGRKNLNLLDRESSSSEDNSSTDNDSDSSVETVNNTIIQKTAALTAQSSEINTMVQTVEVRSSLTSKQQEILKKTEAIRQRTINKIKMSPPKKRQTKRSVTSRTAKSRSALTKKPEKKLTKKEESDTADEDTKKMVTDLWQRGIHLVPNKTPKKKDTMTKVREAAQNGAVMSPDDEFDRQTTSDVIKMVHDENCKGGKLNPIVCPDKKIVIKIYDEHLDRNVDRTISFTPVQFLLNLPSKVRNVLLPRRCKRATSTNKVDCPPEKPSSETEKNDELKKSASPEKSKNAIKRKVRPEDGQKLPDKKAKLQPPLPGNMDIEEFLDKVHGVN